MKAVDVLLVSLLSFAFLAQVTSALGLLVMRNPYDRLHAVAPATLLPPVLIAAAMFCQNGISGDSVKVLLIALVLVVFSPPASHLLGRAARLRDHKTIFTKE